MLKKLLICSAIALGNVGSLPDRGLAIQLIFRISLPPIKDEYPIFVRKYATTYDLDYIAVALGFRAAFGNIPRWRCRPTSLLLPSLKTRRCLQAVMSVISVRGTTRISGS